jgi:hypothetical protein
MGQNNEKFIPLMTRAETIFPNTDISIVIPRISAFVTDFPLMFKFDTDTPEEPPQKMTLAFAICRDKDLPVLLLFNYIDWKETKSKNQFAKITDGETAFFKTSNLKEETNTMHVVFIAYIYEKFAIKLPFAPAPNTDSRFRNASEQDLWFYRIIEKYVRIAHSLKTDATEELLDEYFPTIVDAFKNLISKPGVYGGLIGHDMCQMYFGYVKRLYSKYVAIKEFQVTMDKLLYPDENNPPTKPLNSTFEHSIYRLNIFLLCFYEFMNSYLYKNIQHNLQLKYMIYEIQISPVNTSTKLEHLERNEITSQTDVVTPLNNMTLICFKIIDNLTPAQIA